MAARIQRTARSVKDLVALACPPLSARLLAPRAMWTVLLPESVHLDDTQAGSGAQKPGRREASHSPSSEWLTRHKLGLYSQIMLNDTQIPKRAGDEEAESHYVNLGIYHSKHPRSKENAL